MHVIMHALLGLWLSCMRLLYAVGFIMHDVDIIDMIIYIYMYHVNLEEHVPCPWFHELAHVAHLLREHL